MYKLIPGELLCIGHRGAMGHEPENTLLSITKAIELGVPWIEIDVYTVEGRLLVIHDDTLERTTNGHGYVTERSFAYLRSLDAGKGQRIPTLEEVFELIDRSAGINIELKGPNTAEPVAQFIATYRKRGWTEDFLLVSSFNHREIARIKELDAKINTGALLVRLPVDHAAFAERLGAYSVNVSHEFIDRSFVEDAHSRSLKVFVFTVNEMAEIQRMKDLGVDGVFTNYPERVLCGRK